LVDGARPRRTLAHGVAKIKLAPARPERDRDVVGRIAQRAR
jgi:hypothetical protein